MIIALTLAVGTPATKSLVRHAITATGNIPMMLFPISNAWRNTLTPTALTVFVTTSLAGPAYSVLPEQIRYQKTIY